MQVRRNKTALYLARPQKAGSSWVLYCSMSLKKPSMVPASIAIAKSALPAANPSNHFARHAQDAATCRSDTF